MRDVLGTSTGIMDCNQSEEAEMEEEGLLRITPVWNEMELYQRLFKSTRSYINIIQRSIEFD